MIVSLCGFSPTYTTHEYCLCHALFIKWILFFMQISSLFMSKSAVESNLQWLTTHSLLQYSSSHSELAIAALGQPWRMQVLPGWRLPGPGCCCCCCWACCCCTGAVGPLGEPAPPDTGPPGGGLDTKCWSLRGGLMWCDGGTWRDTQISIHWTSRSDLT
jgi:hypothetical protein